jgi:hypothetical protein
MSKNAQTNYARRARLIEAATLADYGLGGSNSLEAVADQAWGEVAFCEGKNQKNFFSFCEKGEEVWLHRSETVLVRWYKLVPLVQAAAEKLAAAWWPDRDGYGEIFGVIPENFAIPDHTPWGGNNIPSWRYRPEQGRRIVEGYHRCASFLEAAAEGKFPHLKKVLEKTQSTRGASSPRTLWSVFALTERFGTPQVAEARLRHVKWRADMICRSYDARMRASWVGVVAGLMACGNTVGKAAVYAVAETLDFDPEYGKKASYRQAREYLVRLHEEARAAGCSSLDLVEERRLLNHIEGTAGSSKYTDSFREAVAAIPSRYGNSLRTVRRELWASLPPYREQASRSTSFLISALAKGKNLRHALWLAKAYCLGGNAVGNLQADSQVAAWLEDYHCCMVVDKSDGVEVLIDPQPALAKVGATVSRYKQLADGPKVHWTFGWLVRVGDRTYHHSSYGQGGEPSEALRQALKAWKEQDKLLKLKADLVGFLSGDHGFCPLVAREDSYQAGNCSPGTEAWINQNGWGGRKFIPAVWLIPHLDHSLVRNVAMQLYRQHTK